MIGIEKESILQLKTIYDKIIHKKLKEIKNSSFTSLSDTKKIDLSRTNHASSDTLSAHGTNGFALLLAVLTGKQLLPSNERENRGIPTITGEAKYKMKEESNGVYHDEWKNFVSTVSLQNSDPEIDTLIGYANSAKGKFSYIYDDFKRKFNKIYKKVLGVEKLDGLLNSEIMKQLYDKSSNVGIIAIGDGVGYVKLVPSMGCENKCERVNIRAVVIPDKHMGFFQDLFNTVGIDDIALITQSEFRRFCNNRKRSRQKIFNFIDVFEGKFNDFKIEDIPQDSDLERFAKVYGYSITDFVDTFHHITLRDFHDDWNNYPKLPYFSEDFIDTFKNKMPCNFYSDSENCNVTKRMEYKNTDKSFTGRDVQITYSLPKTQIAPGSVVGQDKSRCIIPN